jgi:hypothetical protein
MKGMPSAHLTDMDGHETTRPMRKVALRQPIVGQAAYAMAADRRTLNP